MKRILIIDDNGSNLEMLGLIFTSEGFEVKLLPDPQNIESVLRSFSPRVVLMDIVMGRFSGTDVCLWIKKNPDFPLVKVLLMTASNAFKTLSPSETLADGHIDKPFDIHEVFALVDGLLDQNAG
ncbi:response regulator [Pedobacter psychrodurus]|uniref:Response regulator n=1 Tax=Pedobacter psychrodurus TaxID=2530456 RepID=A0A4R0Q087_9SPHI|nr:response regulator [Pedobacter psychrodurus]TCD26546.1 response regulator [Pedobacter psychrodurus]